MQLFNLRVVLCTTRGWSALALVCLEHGKLLVDLVLNRDDAISAQTFPRLRMAIRIEWLHAVERGIFDVLRPESNSYSLDLAVQSLSHFSASS